MEQSRKYSVEGTEIVVPVFRDDFSGMYLENYEQWYDLDKYTRKGHLILVLSTEACEFTEGLGSYPCVECAVCRFYSRAAPKTLIEVCMNPKKPTRRRGK